MAEGLPAWRVLAATVLANLGLAGMVGAWVSALWLRGATSPWATDSRRRSWAAMKAALVFTVVAEALRLWLQAAAMAEVSLTAASAVLPKMLEQSYVGHAWLGGLLGLLLVLGASSGRQDVLRLSAAGLGLTAFVYSRAAVSHAGDFGLASVQLLVACSHLWAVSLWLGGVAIAAFVVLSQPVGTTAANRAAAAEWVKTLSSVATGALIVIVCSGLYNAWRGLGSTANLMGNAYANTLLVKVSIVTLAVALGGFNRLRLMPPLLSALQVPGTPWGRRQERFVQVLRIEAFVLLAVLIAAAILSSSPPPTAA